LGFGETRPKRLSGGELGHLKRNNLPPLRHVREFRLNQDSNLKAGEKLTAAVFAVGDAVDVVGISKGKGFQGGMKRGPTALALMWLPLWTILARDTKDLDALSCVPHGS
jgi:ribosomal protein L3